MKKTILITIRILLFVIIGLQIHSWISNLENTGIAHNKYDSTIILRKNNVTQSNDIAFVKKEAEEAFDEIIENQHKTHTFGNIIFMSIPIQIGLILIIFILSFFLKRK